MTAPDLDALAESEAIFREGARHGRQLVRYHLRKIREKGGMVLAGYYLSEAQKYFCAARNDARRARACSKSLSLLSYARELEGRVKELEAGRKYALGSIKAACNHPYDVLSKKDASILTMHLNEAHEALKGGSHE